MADPSGAIDEPEVIIQPGSIDLPDEDLQPPLDEDGRPLTIEDGPMTAERTPADPDTTVEESEPEPHDRPEVKDIPEVPAMGTPTTDEDGERVPVPAEQRGDRDRSRAAPT